MLAEIVGRDYKAPNITVKIPFKFQTAADLIL